MLSISGFFIIIGILIALFFAPFIIWSGIKMAMYSRLQKNTGLMDDVVKNIRYEYKYAMHNVSCVVDECIAKNRSLVDMYHWVSNRLVTIGVDERNFVVRTINTPAYWLSTMKRVYPEKYGNLEIIWPENLPSEELYMKSIRKTYHVEKKYGIDFDYEAMIVLHRFPGSPKYNKELHESYLKEYPLYLDKHYFGNDSVKNKLASARARSMYL